ncbi:YjjG family noncanonical pyrimidine nucleotidase [Siansivirga zeaxanthinifaciens]|uniref:Haloacid dehalogenase n=1 Tax=Siansivirga zeaxanthinifaciens CC-SAMT-1 TaxID=1454006 RepID=A0A0C5WAT0_9FLAO|nr:YjjG family noncanonical pyrimidine nucleotidase [Siansivirga zeaxanthinifaciens]AJR02479.1 haloacid dehalogenase [Siansivirga zeaxanthinifaciens CC-SAMT-1]
MKINGITDVFFDLDHTLWDFDKNSALTFSKIFNLNNIQVDLAEFLKHYNEINFNYWKLYRDEKIAKEKLRFGRLNDTFTAINHKVEEATFYKLSEDYITYLTDNNYLFENTIEILNYLSDRYHLHILSNGFEEVQNKKLLKSNIHHYFKTIVNGETFGVKKPNPKIFYYAIEKAQTTADKSVMIGDGFEADILGAIDVGMEVVYFDEFKKSNHANIRTINNLIELKNYL